MNGRSRGAVHGGEFPGFDGLRLISAVAVIVSHSFVIADINPPWKPQNAAAPWLADFAVFTFFIISGFLLTRSLAINANALQFSINRILRILPGFVFCILATAFVIGPLVTPLDAGSYLSQRVTYDYVKSTLSCLCGSWELPFDYAGSRWLRRTINASLWSLPFEALSYVFLLWLSMLLRATWLVAAAIAMAALLTVFFPAAYSFLVGLSFTLPYFAAGVVMYVVYARYGTSGRLAWLALGAFAVTAELARADYAFAIFGAYIVVHVAQRDNIGSAFARRFGDWSYGLYLFGWPVAACVKHFADVESGWLLAACCLPLAGAVAAVSWWLVERPCIRLKRVVHRLVGAAPSSARPLADHQVIG